MLASLLRIVVVENHSYLKGFLVELVELVELFPITREN